MADHAFYDQNNRYSLFAVSNADGRTPVSLWADPNTHGLVISASLSISGADGAITDGVTSGIRATVFNLAGSKPLATQIVDGTGTAITSFGGGTQYADGAAAATPTGTQLNWNEAGTQRSVSATKPLPVDVKNASIPVTGTFWQATQPISGTVTANAGTNLNTSLLALETGGNLASVATNTANIPNTVGTAASAIPSKLLQIGGSDGTNARAVKTNTSGQLDIRPLTTSDAITANIAASQSIAVTQATAASLNATVVGTGTFAVQAAQSGAWNVGSSTPTGSAVPANALYVGFSGVAGNLTGWPGYSLGDGSNSVPIVGIRVYNGTNSDSARTATASSNTTGTGLLGAGVLGHDGTNYQRVKVDTNGTVNVGATTSTGPGLLYSATPTGGTATAVKAAAGTMTAYYIYNPNASVAYVQFFNLGTGSVTPGGTAPLFSLPIPAGSAANLADVAGIYNFSTALTIVTSTTRTGSTAPGTALDVTVWGK